MAADTVPRSGLALLGLVAAAVLMVVAALARQSLRVPRGEWPRLGAIALTNFTLWQVLAAHAVSLLPALAFTAWQMLIGGLPIAMGAVVLESHLWQPLTLTAALGYAYAIVITWTLGYWAWTRAAVTLPLAVSSLGTLAVPVVGVAGSALFLGERPPLTDLAALALLIAALTVLIVAPERVHHPHHP